MICILSSCKSLDNDKSGIESESNISNAFSDNKDNSAEKQEEGEYYIYDLEKIDVPKIALRDLTKNKGVFLKPLASVEFSGDLYTVRKYNAYPSQRLLKNGKEFFPNKYKNETGNYGFLIYKNELIAIINQNESSEDAGEITGKSKLIYFNLSKEKAIQEFSTSTGYYEGGKLSCIYNDEFYYTMLKGDTHFWDNQRSLICRNNEVIVSSERLQEQITSFDIQQDKIFYTLNKKQYNEGYSFYSCDLDGKNNTELFKFNLTNTDGTDADSLFFDDWYSEGNKIFLNSEKVKN